MSHESNRIGGNREDAYDGKTGNFWTKHKIHILFGFAFAMVMQMLPNPRNCIRIHIQCNSPAKSCNDDEAYEKQIQEKVILRKVYKELKNLSNRAKLYYLYM